MRQDTDRRRTSTPHINRVMYYYVYILKSGKNGIFYIGYTGNLRRRLEEHNSGKVFSTKQNIPYELIYFEGYRRRSDAIAREKALKHHGQGFRRLKERLKESSGITNSVYVRGGN